MSVSVGDMIPVEAYGKIIDKHDKIGFNIPILDYLDLEDKDVKNQLLSDSPVFDIIEKKWINLLDQSKLIITPECGCSHVCCILNK